MGLLYFIDTLTLFFSNSKDPAFLTLEKQYARVEGTQMNTGVREN